MKNIATNRLKIEFASAEEYKGARFDACGLIKQVTLDDKYTFCITEEINDDNYQIMRGMGICNEFSTEGVTDAHLKIGVGEIIPNPVSVPGVSLRFTRKNLDTHPDIKCEFTENSAIFSLTQSLGNTAYEYEKKIIANDNKIEIHSKIKNIGQDLIDTVEYYHNFINLNNEPLSEDYVMTLDSVPQNWERKVPGQLTINDNILGFSDKVTEVFYSRTDEINSLSKWELKHKKTGVSMSETCINPIVKFAVWGLGHVFSAEAFTEVKIATGETYNSKRVFEFNA